MEELVTLHSGENSIECLKSSIRGYTFLEDAHMQSKRIIRVDSATDMEINLKFDMTAHAQMKQYSETVRQLKSFFTPEEVVVATSKIKKFSDIDSVTSKRVRFL